MSVNIVGNNGINSSYGNNNSAGTMVSGIDFEDSTVNTNALNSEDAKKSTEDGKKTADKQGVSPKSVEEAVKRANNRISKTHCEFSYNEQVNRVSITVIDDTSGKVVREIPPEESLKMLEKMWEITGLMVDEKR